MRFSTSILTATLAAIAVASPLPRAAHKHKRSNPADTLGITYSPYNDDGTCKDASSVATDLAELTQYDLIRLYGVDCDQVSNVLAAKADGQKLFLGIYYVDAIADGVSTIAAAVEANGSWDDIYTVSVGNELVNSAEATAAQVGAYIDTARTALTAAGYSGPVVSVDTHVAILANKELCEYSDYIAFNAHAFWDGNTAASDSGAWLLGVMQEVASLCGKSVTCVESGWPSQGDTYINAVPSDANQAACLESISEVVGNDTIAFTAFNDLWKDPGTSNCEQYWGILN